MRGKDGPVDLCISHAGITPAYAGKSKTKPEDKPKTEDHPRVCGEKHSIDLLSNASKGSPPRMRGKVSKEL